MIEGVDQVLRAISKALPAILTFLAGFLTAILAEPIRRTLFGPKLKLEFQNNDDFITTTKEKGDRDTHKAHFIRVKVINRHRQLVKGCRGYLVNVELKKENGRFGRTEYCDSIQLAWSCKTSEQKFAGIDLPKGVPEYVDLLSTRPTKPGYRLELAVLPFRYENAFQEPGVYRFTIRVSGDGASPKSIQVCFRWIENWNTIEAWDDC